MIYLWNFFCSNYDEERQKSYVLQLGFLEDLATGKIQTMANKRGSSFYITEMIGFNMFSPTISSAAFNAIHASLLPPPMFVPFFSFSNGTPKRKKSLTFLGSLVLSTSGTNNFGSMASGLFAPAYIKNFQTNQLCEFQSVSRKIYTLSIKTSRNTVLHKWFYELKTYLRCPNPCDDG